MNLITLRELIESSWSKETTYLPDIWTEDNPALGQCAVTAIVVKSYFGGELRKSIALLPNGTRTPHYFNVINNITVDMTWKQFPNGTKLIAIERAFEGDLVSNQWMRERVERLRDSMEQISISK